LIVFICCTVSKLCEQSKSYAIGERAEILRPLQPCRNEISSHEEASKKQLWYEEEREKLSRHFGILDCATK